jgi:hypothetical protein
MAAARSSRPAAVKAGMWSVRSPTVDKAGLTESEAWRVFLDAGANAELFYLDRWMAHRRISPRVNGAIAMLPGEKMQSEPPTLSGMKKGKTTWHH